MILDGARALLDKAPLIRALDLLNGDGEEARVVGGAIRNALVGRTVGDFDIAATATPDIVIARAKSAGLRTIPTGIAHGTVTLLVEGRAFEVTTLREDVATDGRHAKIRFGRDFSKDALRRDFTINALSMGPDGIVHDYTGGIDDLAAGRVRFIGDAETRIHEDYLRILRFFRFSADYADSDLDTAGLSASIRQRAGLARLSRERIHQELMKLLVARSAVTVVAAMTDAGILGTLIQSVPQPARLARAIAIAPEADAILRLAATAVLVSEDATRLRDTLRLANSETSRLEKLASALVAFHGTKHPPDAGTLRAALFEHGRIGAIDALTITWGDSGSDPTAPDWQKARRFLEETPEPHLPFSGSDLVARGVRAGKPLGQALKRLQANWIRAGFPDDPQQLAKLLADATDTAHH